MFLQAILFDRNYYTIQEARQFLKRQNIIPKKAILITDRYYRARLLVNDYRRHYYRIHRLGLGLDCIFLEFNK